ncbi:MAG: GtrA family protein [Planctomycetes bacterium]|nr:GtrA family protein [Planctomycetota bacterium]
MLQKRSLQVLKRLLVEPVDSVHLQVPRALVASTLSAIVDCAIYFWLVIACRVHPLAAAVVGYLIGGVVQYVLCAGWVFPHAPSNVVTGFLRFTALSMVGLVITCLSMAILMDGISLHYAPARIIALFVAFGWNFLSRKFLLFRAELSK